MTDILRRSLVGSLVGLAFGVFGVWVTKSDWGDHVGFIIAFVAGGAIAAQAWRLTRASTARTGAFYLAWIVTGILFMSPLLVADRRMYGGDLFSGIGMVLVLGGALGASGAALERRLTRRRT